MKVRYIEDKDFIERNGVNECPCLTDGKEYEVEDFLKMPDGELRYEIQDDFAERDCANATPYSTDLFVPVLYNCPCCGYPSFREQDAYEICSVCDWEDDIVQKTAPDYECGANKLSLNQHRERWTNEKKLGVHDRQSYDMAKNYSRYNRAALEKDKVCGCYCCETIFSPTEINEWCCESARGDEVTALCPNCGIDSVIAESSGYPITPDFLKTMNGYAFE
jgi:hypothetical protein